MENTPVAAPQGTEAPQANINPTPAPAQAQEQVAQPAQPAAPVANIPADQIEAFNRFIEGNGGFEKAFSKLKSGVSAPQQQTQPQPQPQPQVQPQSQPQYQQTQREEEYRTPTGYISQNEWNVRNYYRDLASLPEYASISDEIKNGAVLSVMGKFGIRATDRNGAINDQQVRDFLDMYAKTKPSPEHSAPVSNTPTAEYINVGEQVSSRDDALAILRQNMQLGGNFANHPQTQAAQEFLKNYFKK